MSPREADPAVGAQLVRVAAALLAEEGPAALSTRRLAAAVGASTTAVYTQFGGKSDLVRAMVRDGFQLLDRRLGAVGESRDPVADIGALGWAYRRNALEHRHLYSVMFGGAGLSGFSLSDEDRQHGRYTLRALVRAVERSIETGRLDEGDPQMVAHQMWIALHGLVTLELGGYLVEPYEPDDCFEAQVLGLLVGAGADRAESAVSLRRARERCLPRDGE
ncbi:TetR/AcrR family transcriptional regulator [Streptomyces sp. R302]|uniref:WHG domain-containing protein n=1 Tax=unclassified Streptomyces TaxID=2593676 RepID=UPI00145F6C54|nr:TetR/AcrR family transcriptional regulator [Streptomyces sp. R301]NML81092.1 TetR/AcrR family transcriptional regulator [Streptomyces sp. R302]